MEIWLRQNKKSFRFAILPSEYELTSESDNTQVNINKLGEINLIGKRKLKTVSFSSIFPKQKYSFCQYSTFPTPKESVKTIEKMKNNGVLSLTMTGTPINMDCTIESFTWGENDGTKDINFTLEFKEYRKVTFLRRRIENRAAVLFSIIFAGACAEHGCRCSCTCRNAFSTVDDCRLGVGGKTVYPARHLESKSTAHG